MKFVIHLPMNVLQLVQNALSMINLLEILKNKINLWGEIYNLNANHTPTAAWSCL
jgi:hypothetical protein